ASFHAEHAPGELIERIDGDVSAIATFFSRFIVEVLGSGIFLIGALVLLYLVDVRVGALLTFFALAALLFMTRGGGFVAARARARRPAPRRRRDHARRGLSRLSLHGHAAPAARETQSPDEQLPAGDGRDLASAGAARHSRAVDRRGGRDPCTGAVVRRARWRL